MNILIMGFNINSYNNEAIFIYSFYGCTIIVTQYEFKYYLEIFFCGTMLDRYGHTSIPLKSKVVLWTIKQWDMIAHQFAESKVLL